MVQKQVASGNSFALETTLSGMGYARMIPQWRALGYKVKLVFLTLPSADFAVQRVSERVKHGGHNILEAVIRRRFDTGLRNFNAIYKLLVDSWILIDNKAAPFKVLEWSDNE
jgi:predicted ABC-type ATPase